MKDQQALILSKSPDVDRGGGPVSGRLSLWKLLAYS